MDWSANYYRFLDHLIYIYCIAYVMAAALSSVIPTNYPLILMKYGERTFARDEHARPSPRLFIERIYEEKRKGSLLIIVQWRGKKKDKREKKERKVEKETRERKYSFEKMYSRFSPFYFI